MSSFTEEFAKLRKPAEIARDALATELKILLAECTDKQQEFFARVYPGKIDSLAENTLKSAIDLVQRTLAKNRAGR